MRSMPALSVLLFIMVSVLGLSWICNLLGHYAQALSVILFGSILFLAEEGTWYAPTADCGDGPGSCAAYGDSGVYMREDVSS